MQSPLSQPSPVPERKRDSSQTRPSPPTSEHARERIAELSAMVRERLRDCGVESAWRLTHSDLSLALLNGAALKSRYSLPAPPEPAGECAHPGVQNLVQSGAVEPEAFIARRESNPLLFIHALHLARHTGEISLDDVPHVINLGFKSISAELYPEYLGILQKAGLAVSQHPERFIELGSRLIAETNIHVGPPYALAAVPPLLRVKARMNDRLLISSMEDEKLAINLPDGESLIVLGSGYNALLEFEKFRTLKRTPCIVHDDNPFTSVTLNRHLELNACDNIRIDGSDMRRLEFGSVPPGAALFDLTPDADRRSVAAFLRRFFSEACSNRAVISLQRVDDNPDVFSSATMHQLLHQVGFQIRFIKQFSAPSGALAPGIDRNTASTTPPEELAALLQKKDSVREVKKLELLAAVIP